MLELLTCPVGDHQGGLVRRNPFSGAGVVPTEQKEMGIPGRGKSV